jgi:ribonuclease HI
MTITAAADGSALGNPGPAGWAWAIDEQTWAAGGWPHATNNRGELQAVLELFRATAHVDDDLLVLCDSQYAINCITKWMPGWKAKGWRKHDGSAVLNVDLLQQLDEAIKGRRYRFEWVKGHAGHDLNELADRHARDAATAFQRGGEVPIGPGFPGAPASAEPVLASAPTAAVETPEPPASEPDAEGDGLDDAQLDDTLFSFDDEPDTEVTVRLDAAQLRRLERRAREAGVSAEQFLRGLV